MSSQKYVLLILVALLFSGCLFAFNPSSYLYPNESSAVITYTNFSSNSIPYALLNVNGNPVLLIKNGVLDNDSSDISSALTQYYSSQYYPSQSQIANLQNLITQFNISRNAGFDYKGEGEYTCRDQVLLSGGTITVANQSVTCTNPTNCQENALIVFGIYQSAAGWGSVSDVLQPLESFDFASFDMDALLGNYTQDLSSLNVANAASTFSYIVSTSPELTSDANSVATTIFRSPRSTDSTDISECETSGCLGLCPSMNLNISELSLISSTAHSLSLQVAPIASLQSTISSVISQTSARTTYQLVQSTGSVYLAQYAPLNASASSALALATTALSHVSNTTLSSSFQSLQSLNSQIPAQISSGNFTNINSELSNYQTLTSYVNNLSSLVLTQYNAAKSAKDQADSNILQLQTRNLDPTSASALLSLQTQSSELDSNFQNGLTVFQFQSLEANYSSIVSKSQNLLDSDNTQPAAKSVVLLDSIATSVNTELANFSGSSNIINAKQFETNPAVSFGSLAVVIFVAFSSLAFLIFMYLMVSLQSSNPKFKRTLTIAFISGLLFILTFSVLSYAFLNQSVNNASLAQFNSGLSSKSSANIFVDLRSAPSSASTSMTNCANSLAANLEAKNKPTSVYLITQSSCTSLSTNSTTSVSNCLSQLNNEPASTSSFDLAYSTTPSPIKLSVIYSSSAELSGNADYYNSCLISSVFN